MLLQLPEEKRDIIRPLFSKRQPNCSALCCYFNGTMPGKTYVDNLAAPTKAIIVLDMSWTYVSDNADFPWIEQTLEELCKITWMQVIWSFTERPQRPSKGVEVVIPRFEYTHRNPAVEKTVPVSVLPSTDELFEQCKWKDWNIQTYVSKENFMNKTICYYAVEEDHVCSEFEAAFIADGYTEIGIITAEGKRRQGFAYAACLRGLEEIENRGLKPIWACDKDNTGSVKLAEKLGFHSPFEYEFLYYPHRS